VSARRWRLIGLDEAGQPGSAPGPYNMALDVALLEGVQAGGRPALRLYRWSHPCLSLGRNQPARGFYDAAAAAASGLSIVRRPTGGMAVLHDAELTYAVAAPVRELGSPRVAYLEINRALVAGLRRLGVAAQLAVAGFVPPPVPGPCFQAAAPGEVEADGRKLVGSAQRRQGRALLQHGSILVGGSQAAAAELAGVGEHGPPPALLAELLGRVPTWQELSAAVVAGFETALGICFAREPISSGELTRARALTRQFASPEWTWRR
jgi:lipoyl(octanoyl) transferase